MKYNLCCGRDIRPGWVNVDKNRPADVLTDLSEESWCDLRPGKAHHVLMKQALSAFERPDVVMRNIHRLLEPEGTVTIIDNHAQSVTANWLEARTRLSWCFFDELCDTDANWSVTHGVRFATVSYRVHLLYNSITKWTPLDVVASRFPYFWEKVSFGALRPAVLEWTGRRLL